MNTLFEPPQHHPARLRHTAVVNTHGASVVGFAFTDLLEFRLLPRLKNIGAIKLYSPDDTASTWPALGEGDREPADQLGADRAAIRPMVKYATAPRLGTAEAEQTLRRFTTGGGSKSPTYRCRCSRCTCCKVAWSTPCCCNEFWTTRSGRTSSPPRTAARSMRSSGRM
jgi:hypothetical protein